MNEAQQVFSVFYAIFFGIMIQTLGARRTNSRNEDGMHDATLNLFDTPDAWAIGPRLNNKPLWRSLLSIIFVNVLPGIIFAIIFLGLQSSNKSLNVLDFIIIVLLSLTPQYLYRVYYAFLVKFKERLYLNKNEYPSYNHYDLDALALLEIDRVKYKGHNSFQNHIAFPLFFFFPILILLYGYLIQLQINCLVIWIALALIIAGILSFILVIRD